MRVIYELINIFGNALTDIISCNFVYFRKYSAMTQYNISFAGAGRVAGALCREMYLAGHNIEFDCI